MANRDNADGFRIHKKCLQRNKYYVGTDAGLLGVGDPVVRQTNSADPNGYSEIVRATTGSEITGVIESFEFDPDRSTKHIASAATGYAFVADHPDQEFVVQDNGGATGMAVTDLGNHIDSVAAIDASTDTGRSKYEIDTEAKAADNTWIVVRALDKVDNDPTLANARWVVKANLHTEANGAATRIKEI